MTPRQELILKAAERLRAWRDQGRTDGTPHGAAESIIDDCKRLPIRAHEWKMVYYYRKVSEQGLTQLLIDIATAAGDGLTR